MSIISAGGVIGEEIFVGENRPYCYTCTVLSPTAVILVGEKKSIDTKFPLSIKQILISMWLKKERLHKLILDTRSNEIAQQIN